MLSRSIIQRARGATHILPSTLLTAMQNTDKVICDACCDLRSPQSRDKPLLFRSADPLTVPCQSSRLSRARRSVKHTTSHYGAPGGSFGAGARHTRRLTRACCPADRKEGRSGNRAVSRAPARPPPDTPRSRGALGTHTQSGGLVHKHTDTGTHSPHNNRNLDKRRDSEGVDGWG